MPLFNVRLKRRSLCVTVYNNQNNLQTQNKVAGVSHLTRALTVERTTLESRNRGVTRMWNRDREAKATAGDRSASSEMWTWTTNVCGGRQADRGQMKESLDSSAHKKTRLCDWWSALIKVKHFQQTHTRHSSGWQLLEFSFLFILVPLLGGCLTFLGGRL